MVIKSVKDLVRVRVSVSFEALCMCNKEVVRLGTAAVKQWCRDIAPYIVVLRQH